MDWLINKETGDIDLDRAGGTTTIVDGSEAVLQQIRIRLLFFAREWYLDQRLGIDYFAEILVKDPRMSRVRFLFRQTIVTTPGVIELVRFDVSKPDQNRLIVVSFLVRLSDGSLVDSNANGPFVLDPLSVIG